MEASFNFPVLGISHDNDVWGFPDLRRLTTCGPRTLKDGMQRDLELIDAQGQRWVVTSVRTIGPAGSIPGRWFSTLLTGKPQFRIEHELKALEPLSVGEVKDRVCAAMRAHPDFWCEPDERDTVLRERIADVQATKTIVDIHETLGLDTFEGY